LFKKVLAIETSCDDTSVALVGHDGYVFQLISASQDEAHGPFGGIVPEIACRNHTVNLIPMVDEVLRASKTSWEGIDGLVVTNRPGLVGSLIVGVVAAKALALSFSKPLLGVSHLEGHILAPFLYDEKNLKTDLQFPYVALAVSGGHTTLYHVQGLGDYSILGSTLDDAAGEAFDKFAKMIGLGFPGGAKVDQLAKAGDLQAFSFPRALIKEENLQMSFSGLKSAGTRLWEGLSKDEQQARLPDLCASFQEAVVDVLLAKLQRAAEGVDLKQVVITGGVSANSRLRTRAQELAQRIQWQLFIPPVKYCTDNAAMIGYAGIQRFLRGEKHDMNLGPSPQIQPGDFREGSIKKGRQSRVKNS
jgi:N6-L-threonylcarbamoyladenine synthase